MGSNINKVRAEKMIREYADGLDSLTDQECNELGISPNSCNILQEVLGWGSNGTLTPDEEKSLIDAGFARGFVENLAGTDGKKALRQRVKWLAGHLDHLNHLNSKGGVEERRVEDVIKVLAELYHISPDVNGAIGALTYVVKDKNQIVDARRIAVRTLGIMGLYGMSSQDAKMVVSALIMAMDIGDPGQYKNAVLARSSLGLSKDAILTLGAIGPRARVAVPYIVIALKHEDPDMRVNASFALLRIGPGASNAVSALTAALEDPDPRVQMNAVGALGAIGPRASGAVADLEKRLTNRNPFVRKNAAMSLGEIGLPTESLIAALKNMAKNDPELDCRTAAKMSLKMLRGLSDKSDASGPTLPQATLLK